MSDKRLALWELEFLKCHSKDDFRKYVDKYKNTPENPFLRQAEIKLSEPKKSAPSEKKGAAGGSDSPKGAEVMSFFRSADFLKLVGVGVAIVIGIFLVTSIRDGLRDNMHESQQKEFLAKMDLEREYAEKYRNHLEDLMAEHERKIEEINQKYSDLKKRKSSSSGSTSTSTSSASSTSSSASYYQPKPTNVYVGNSGSGWQNQNSSMREDNSRWVNYYNETYSRMTRTAESAYKSLTNLGSTWTDRGERYGNTGRDDLWVGEQINIFKKLQHDMRSLRHEAATKGITISESAVESYNIHI